MSRLGLRERNARRDDSLPLLLFSQVKMGIEELRQILLPREAHLAPTVEYDAKRLREFFRGSQSAKGKATSGKGSNNVSQRPSSNRRSFSVLPMQMKDDALSTSSVSASVSASASASVAAEAGGES